MCCPLPFLVSENVMANQFTCDRRKDYELPLNFACQGPEAIRAESCFSIHGMPFEQDFGDSFTADCKINHSSCFGSIFIAAREEPRSPQLLARVLEVLSVDPALFKGTV